MAETGIPKYFTFPVSAWAGGGFFGPAGAYRPVTVTVVVFVPPIAQPERMKANRDEGGDTHAEDLTGAGSRSRSR